MKFGKQFDFYKIPEWSEYYLDYTFIKKLLKFLDTRSSKKKSLKKLKKLQKEQLKQKKQLQIGNLSPSSSRKGSSNQSESSYVPPQDNMEEEDNAQANLVNNDNTNTNDKHTSPNNSMKVKYDFTDIDFSQLSDNDKLSRFIEVYKKKLTIIEYFFLKKISEFEDSFKNLKHKMNVKRSMSRKESFKATTKLLNAERDELGYAVSWKRAMSNLYNSTSWLHSYFSINSLAIQKIEKKTRKVFHMLNIQQIDQELLNLNNSFKWLTFLPKWVELRKKIKTIYSQELTDNNLKSATLELEQRMGGSRVKHTKLIAFYWGIIISVLWFLIWIHFIKPDNDNNSIIPFFPAFNFTLIVIEVMLGVGINIIVLRKYRINYWYIFEIEPKLRWGHMEMFQNGLLLLSIWITSLLLTKWTICFGLFNTQYALFSLVINLALAIFLFFPFHCSYLEFRKGIISTFVKNLFPIGKNGVRFRDFLFGDILTSLNKPFVSMILSICLLACDNCRKMNIRNSEECNRENIPALIVLWMPFVIRFFQCLNRLYYTREAWPHWGNTIKYVGGWCNVIFGWIYDRDKNNNNKWFMFLIAACVSQCYMLFWDIYMDWNLGRISSKNFFLRDKIVYPKTMYYGAMLINAFLRFSWTWNFIVIPDNWKEWKIMVMAILEAYRRIQWCIFRIENENTNNPEKYRAILAIPDLPID